MKIYFVTLTLILFSLISTFGLLLNILVQNMNPGRGTFGKPYDSTQGFTVKGQTILLFIIIAFGLYIGFMVWRSLRNERRNKK